MRTILQDLTSPVDPDRDHWRGGEGAVVTLVEYDDYECPYSRMAFRPHAETLAMLGGGRAGGGPGRGLLRPPAASTARSDSRRVCLTARFVGFRLLWLPQRKSSPSTPASRRRKELP